MALAAIMARARFLPQGFAPGGGASASGSSVDVPGQLNGSSSNGNASAAAAKATAMDAGAREPSAMQPVPDPQQAAASAAANSGTPAAAAPAGGDWTSVASSSDSLDSTLPLDNAGAASVWGSNATNQSVSRIAIRRGRPWSENDWSPDAPEQARHRCCRCCVCCSIGMSGVHLHSGRSERTHCMCILPCMSACLQQCWQCKP